MTAEKVRFAPSPTGLLHVGNLRTALVNYLYARHAGGAFMLRIDDTDEERSTAEFEAAIRADLTWMGMVWDMEDRQSDRLRRYDEALQQLLADQRAYACYETAEELALKRKSQLMAGKPPVYDRAGLLLSAAEKSEFEAQGRRPHYRFLLDQDSEVVWQDLVRGPQSIQMSSLSDPVLLREDGRVIYTLASVVDDLDHGITTILRGEDHVTNSAAQIQLFEALGRRLQKWGIWPCWPGLRAKGCRKGWAACLSLSCVLRELKQARSPACWRGLAHPSRLKPMPGWPRLLRRLILAILAALQRNLMLRSCAS